MIHDIVYFGIWNTAIWEIVIRMHLQHFAQYSRPMSRAAYIIRYPGEAEGKPSSANLVRLALV